MNSFKPFTLMRVMSLVLFGLSQGISLQAAPIASTGSSVGTFSGSSDVTQNYSFTPIVVPSATYPGGTTIKGISGNLITGTYPDVSGMTHGFLYDGTNFTTIDNPLADTNGNGISIIGILGNTIAGSFYDAKGTQKIFYYNTATKKFTNIPVPSTYKYPYFTSFASGSVYGSFYQADSGLGIIYNGSKWITIKYPIATKSGYTFISGLSGSNVVGSFQDSPNYYMHGFLYNGKKYLALESLLIKAGGLEATGATEIASSYISGIVGSTIYGYFQDSEYNMYNFSYDASSSNYSSLDYSSINLGAAILVSSNGIVVDPYDGTFTLINPTDLTSTTIPSPEGSLANYSSGNVIAGVSATQVVGTYYDSNNVTHGYSYDLSSSTFSTVEAPLAVVNLTLPKALSGGLIVGNYVDSNALTHGFIYDIALNNYTSIDVPDGVSGTTLAGVAPPHVYGSYTDSDNLTHGYVYNITNDSFTSVDDPNQAIGFDSQDSAIQAQAITGIAGDTVIGNYSDANNLSHGFTYSLANSNFTTIDDPNAFFDTNTFSATGTYLNGISTNGVIIGNAIPSNYGYMDTNNSQGFIYTITNTAFAELNQVLGISVASANGIDGSLVVGSYNNSNGFIYNTATKQKTTYKGYPLSGVSGTMISAGYFTFDSSVAKNKIGTFYNSSAITAISGNAILGKYGYPSQLSYLALPKQTITFPSISTKVFGTAPFALKASSTSKLPIEYKVLSGLATVSGNMVTLTGTGKVTIQAGQSGNSNYAAAINVTQSFTVTAKKK